jgi:nitroreductase
VFTKDAETQVRILDVIARRWSGRAFDPERRVDRQTLIALLEAARWAPSCFGDQPWRYLIWDRSADPDNWTRAFNCLSESNQAWVRRAPLLMLASADSLFESTGRSNRWGQYDTGAASMSLCLQATAMGLMVHQMGGFNAEKIRAEFQIPERFACMAMIALGYQLPEDRIPEDLREREHAPRIRRPLEESFFLSRWGNGFK